MRGKRGFYGIMAGILILSVCIPGKLSDGKTAPTEMNITAVTKTKTKIKLRWKKKAVTQYRIYRTAVRKDGKLGKQKRIATISGKRTSYTNKVPYKKRYLYKVEGYQKKGKKWKKKCVGEELAYSGMGAVQWEENHYCDARVTPKSIPLKVYLDSGFKPTAYEIYRSTDGKKYTKLATVKRKAQSLKYTDKKVTSHQSYYYKVRAYRVLGKKKYYGAYTEPLQFSAVNATAKFKTQVLTKEGASVSALTVCLTSDKDNGVVRLTDGGSEGYLYWQPKGDFAMIQRFRYSKYSFDNKTWTSARADKAVIWKPGQSIYLQFTPGDGKAFSYRPSAMSFMILHDFEMLYNNLWYLLRVDLKGQGTAADLYGELYH